MTVNLNTLFESEIGKRIYSTTLAFLKKHGMEKAISGGVLVGFSGGADSVMLLSFLKKYSDEIGGFKILAVHINHKIRGKEADFDEEFSRRFAEALGIEFIAKSFDVPKMANELSMGIEEAAREIRYSAFREIIQGRNDIFAIATAHNSTDNLETVIFNMMRGTGARGMAGIAPTRDNIVRPLMACAKFDIVKALTDAGVEFVTDSTNLKNDYKRNYIRHEILPKLSTLSDNPEAMATRMSANLRTDDDYILGVANEFLNRFVGGKIPKNELSSLHFSPFSRVISQLFKQRTGGAPESVHITEIYELIGSKKQDFSVSLPKNMKFVSEGGYCDILPDVDKEKLRFFKKLTLGVNEIPEINAEIILSNEEIENNSVKIYKSAIQQIIYFDIINSELYVREKQDGDSYVFGKMTRKVKKLFNDKNISKSDRERLPIFCDGEGILFVPTFPVRDGRKSDKKLYILVGYKE